MIAAVLSWLINSRLGRAVGAALAFLAFLATFGAYNRRKGAQKATERVSRRAQAAAEARERDREEIDADADADAARDRVRANWSDPDD